jgi:hypothetical protein
LFLVDMYLQFFAYFFIVLSHICNRGRISHLAPPPPHIPHTAPPLLTFSYLSSKPPTLFFLSYNSFQFFSLYIIIIHCIHSITFSTIPYNTLRPPLPFPSNAMPALHPLITWSAGPVVQPAHLSWPSPTPVKWSAGPLVQPVDQPSTPLYQAPGPHARRQSPPHLPARPASPSPCLSSRVPFRPRVKGAPPQSPRLAPFPPHHYLSSLSKQLKEKIVPPLAGFSRVLILIDERSGQAERQNRSLQGFPK